MTRWRLIEDRDVPHVIALWNKCRLTRPWNDPGTDIDFARRGPSSAVLVWEIEDQIVASVMVGHDGHRGTLYYVGVDPTHRDKGLGREVVKAAEQWLADHGVWKINILVRNDNKSARDFWTHVGFVESPVVSFQKAIAK